MKKLNKNVLRLVANMAKNEVEKNNSVWPPICSGLLHQPKRPKK